MEAKVFLSSLLMAVGAMAVSKQTHNAVQTEMFSIPISPNMFNWTYQEFDEQYRFHASLLGRPQLPSWLRYIYSRRHHSGFIFGTPPFGTQATITLEVIGLNREDYETRRLHLTLKIKPKDTVARHEVKLKIDNLNVEDLLDEHRMSRLKEIFKSKLWIESANELYVTFLASAIDLGGRLPLRPNEGEGLVVRFGSSKPFSVELKRLREEVRPLSRLTSCPRDYKRTTVERLFRDNGLALDWCNFQLYNTIYSERTTTLQEYLMEVPSSNRKPNLHRRLDYNPWTAPDLKDLPSRSYLREFTVAVLVPVLLMFVSVTALTAVLCFHYAGIAHKPGKVELCRYETNNTEQTQVHDNNSSRSLGVSPNNSLARPYSPKSSTNLAGSYNRPQPPPYIGSTSNSLHHRKSGEPAQDTGHNSHLALEESLKLLNEAKIGADFIDDLNLESEPNPVIDLNDGSEDYVPIKGDYMLKADLDDINVPELSKYGLGGVSSSGI